MVDQYSQHSYLYVEDDPLSREIMQMILKDVLGVTNLIMLENSSDFIAKLKSLNANPDVILLDIHVRPCDGFEMLRLLRMESEFQHSKVIALTASVMNEEVEKLRKSGFDGTIGKPLSIQTFPNLLGRILDGQSVWHVA
jgi:CheY-like chemotaxis protein